MAAGLAEAVEDLQAAVEHEASLVHPAEDFIGKSFEEPCGVGVHKRGDGGWDKVVRGESAAGGEGDGLWKNRGGGCFFKVNMVLGIDRAEILGDFADGFAHPEHESPAHAEGEIQDREDALLAEGLEVDEEIPAADEIEPVEGRIFENVVFRENHIFADGALDLVGIPLGCEIFFEEVRGDIRRDACGIDALAGDLEGIAIQIGRKDFEGHPGVAMLGDRLGNEDGDRVGFLSGGACGHPNPQLPIVGFFHQAGQDRLAQSGESLWIAEKRGHANEHVFGEILALGGVGLQVGEIIFENRKVAEAHTALEAAVHALLLVVSDIETGMALEEAL